MIDEDGRCDCAPDCCSFNYVLLVNEKKLLMKNLTAAIITLASTEPERERERVTCDTFDIIPPSDAGLWPS